MSVSPVGLVYISDRNNHRVTVQDEEGMFLLAFGSKGSGPQFGYPLDVAVGSDGLVYVANECNTVCAVIFVEGIFRGFAIFTFFVFSNSRLLGTVLLKYSQVKYLWIYGVTPYTVIVYTSCRGFI